MPVYVRARVCACVGARARVCGPLDLLSVSVAVSSVAAPGPARSARPSATNSTTARDPPTRRRARGPLWWHCKQPGWVCMDGYLTRSVVPGLTAS